MLGSWVTRLSGPSRKLGQGSRHSAPADRVLVSCITSCGRCRFCRESRYGLCTGGGGWILGHLIDGTQAEYVRVPFADTSTYPNPDEVADEAVLMLADIGPTGYEIGVLNGAIRPGDTVAVVGAGPIGLSSILTAQLFSPSQIAAIDLADSRLDAAKRFGASVVINNGREDAEAIMQQITDGLGADVTIEAVGVPKPSNSAPGSSVRAAMWPTWAFTASRPRCTWRTSGSRT
jgi:alcohol dehydrogenase